MDATIHTNGRFKGHELVKPAKRKPGRRKALAITQTQVGNLRKYITIGAGCFIPVLSLSLSHMGGSRLASDSPAEMACGFALLGLCITVLCVSLAHLADAIQDITNSTTRASWALAGSCDLTMVATELSTTFATSDQDWWLRLSVMVAVTAGSMVLNVWSFLKHAAAKWPRGRSAGQSQVSINGR